MKNALNASFWTGVTLFGFSTILLGLFAWVATSAIESIPQTEEVVHDTVYINVEVIKEVPIEIIKEVQIECTKKHLEVPKPSPVQQLPVKVQQDTLSDTNI